MAAHFALVVYMDDATYAEYPRHELKEEYRAPALIQLNYKGSHSIVVSSKKALKTRLLSLKYEWGHGKAPAAYDLNFLKAHYDGYPTVAGGCIESCSISCLPPPSDDSELLKSKAALAFKACLFASDFNTFLHATFRLQKALQHIQAVVRRTDCENSTEILQSFLADRAAHAGDYIADRTVEFLSDHADELLSGSLVLLPNSAACCCCCQSDIPVRPWPELVGPGLIDLRLDSKLSPFLSFVFEVLPVLARDNPLPLDTREFTRVLSGAYNDVFCLDVGEMLLWKGYLSYIIISQYQRCLSCHRGRCNCIYTTSTIQTQPEPTRCFAG